MIFTNSSKKVSLSKGVYDADPMTNPDAERFEQVSYDKVIENKLNVMDATAIVMCRDNQLPLRVFDLTRSNALVEAMAGEKLGTLISA